jgi:hypothetical protein
VRRRTGKTLAEIASLPSSWASLDPGTIANSADPELLEHEPRWATESEHAEAPWRALRITPMYDFPRHEEGSWSDLIATAPNEGEVPTTRGSTSKEGPDTLPEWLSQGEVELATVDETPLMRLLYLDANGKKAQDVLQVERIDLEKRLIIGRTETPGEVRKIFLHQVLAAHSVETGQRFDLDT